jgi:hypothetical protein
MTSVSFIVQNFRTFELMRFPDAHLVIERWQKQALPEVMSMLGINSYIEKHLGKFTEPSIFISISIN